MKLRLPLLAFLGLSAALLLFNSCLRDRCTSTRTFVRYDPIYKTPAEIRVAPTVEAARPLKKPGKIYAFDKYLFINELEEGIHVIDNSDPAKPQALAFWRIPGNVDIAISGHHLYADQYTDLLSLDISNLQAPQLSCRVENAFSLNGYDPYRGFIVGYTETEVTEEIDCNDSRVGSPWFWMEDAVFVNKDLSSSGGAASLPAGIGGSYARFALNNQYLYTVDNTSLKTYSIFSPDCPVRFDSVMVGWNIETIFPWKSKLFIGSQNGVFIYNIANPQDPVFESAFTHASGCDPVVCDDKYAYVTIHDGTTCNGTVNQLDVIGISALPAASLLTSYPMKHPNGLALQGDKLFLCDDGLKVYDNRDPLAMAPLAHLKDLHAYDVIALDATHLLLIGDDGFFQFDTSDPAHPVQLSHIPVEN